jgi:hypothetical protein
VHASPAFRRHDGLLTAVAEQRFRDLTAFHSQHVSDVVTTVMSLDAMQWRWITSSSLASRKGNSADG